MGRLLYALVFCVGVPGLLWSWARLLEPKLSALPLLHAPWPGGLIALVGAGCLLRGFWDLWFTGGGLPMNAYPPPRRVTTGVYRWLGHPIYTGFALLVAGVSVAGGSRAGIWVVSPVVALAMLSLALGYERLDLARRFGRDGARDASGDTAPSFARRCIAGLRAFGPWLVAYPACTLLGPSHRYLDTMLPFERTWPVWEATAVLYLGAYLWTLLAPVVAATDDALHQFERSARVGTWVIIGFFLACPFVALPRPIDPDAWGASWLLFDRSLDTFACAWPSFHVFWAFVAADAWSARIGRRISLGLATLISASCITTGVHSLLDVLAGIGVYAAAAHRERLVSAALRLTERVANSWRDWRLGPVRIINHGLYVGAAAALGLWGVGLALGGEATPAIVTVAWCSLIGAGLWGQAIEASSQLSRPFGYFGGLYGGVVGVVFAQVFFAAGWQVCGAFALMSPVIQGVGRLRCLVQGCCHGQPVFPGDLGIRYTQPLSRVCKLAGLGGVSLYPTPLYSIVTNIALFGLIARLWYEGADLAVVTGSYLILSTCARFAEEGYRGEPQTVRWAGLALYQWLALGGLLAGMAVLTVPAPRPPPWSGVSFAPLAYALPFGLLVAVAMGVDFPESKRRMSRLA